MAVEKVWVLSKIEQMGVEAGSFVPLGIPIGVFRSAEIAKRQYVGDWQMQNGAWFLLSRGSNFVLEEFELLE